MPKRSNAGRVYNRNKRARVARRAAFKGRQRRRRIGRPSRGLRQSTYLFKRRITSVVNLSTAPGSDWIALTGGNAVYRQWHFSLNDLAANADSTDFTNLFRRYKINAVKVELAFTNTGSVPASNGNNPSNYQLQVYTMQNRSGRTEEEVTEQMFLNTQASSKRLALNGGKPLKYYMKVNQLTETYASTTNTDYAVTRPRYISTGETGAQHYGLNMLINRVDGEPLTTGLVSPQHVRCTLTYYMSFKGVE